MCVCEQYGLQMFVLLPPRFSSVEELWAEHAERYLKAPSRFPLRRATRRFESPAADAAPMHKQHAG
jgi:hypothetical protein